MRRFSPDQMLAVLALGSALAAIILMRKWLHF